MSISELVRCEEQCPSNDDHIEVERRVGGACGLAGESCGENADELDDVSELLGRQPEGNTEKDDTNDSEGGGDGDHNCETIARKNAVMPSPAANPLREYCKRRREPSAFAPTTIPMASVARMA